MWTTCLVTVLFACIGISLQASPWCSPGYGNTFPSCQDLGGFETDAGVCFFFPPGKRSWAEAEQVCRANGGTLASFNGENENYLVLARINGGEGNWHRSPPYAFWIGLSDHAMEGTFAWSDGTSREYNRWGRNEPSAGKRCVALSTDFRWQTITCSEVNSFVCSRRPGLSVQVAPCEACEAGKYSMGEECLACPAGTFASSPASTACSDCPFDAYAPAGSSSCIPDTRPIQQHICAVDARPQGDLATCSVSFVVPDNSSRFLVTLDVEEGDNGEDYTPFHEKLVSVTANGRHLNTSGIVRDQVAGLEECRSGALVRVVNQAAIQPVQRDGVWQVDVDAVGETWDNLHCTGTYLYFLFTLAREPPLWAPRTVQAACQEKRSWRELAYVFNARPPYPHMISGGLGSRSIDGFESWVCLRGHPCLSDPRVNGAEYDWMCFVYDEAKKEFHAWGKESDLRLSLPNTIPQPWDPMDPLSIRYRRRSSEPKLTAAVGDSLSAGREATGAPDMDLFARCERAEEALFGEARAGALGSRINAVEAECCRSLGEVGDDLHTKLLRVEAMLGVATRGNGKS